MSKHYTDDDLRAAVKATRRVRGGTIVGLLVQHEVRMALDAVAPAIAARALREAADDMALRLSGHSGVSVKGLRFRADEIEAGR